MGDPKKLNNDISLEEILKEITQLLWENSNQGVGVTRRIRKIHDADLVAAYRAGFARGKRNEQT